MPNIKLKYTQRLLTKIIIKIWLKSESGGDNTNDDNKYIFTLLEEARYPAKRRDTPEKIIYNLNHFDF